MTVAVPAIHREVRLATRPQGALRTDHFRVVEAPVPEPGPGQVLVRNRLMSVVAVMRTLMRGDARGGRLPLTRSDRLVGHRTGCRGTDGGHGIRHRCGGRRRHPGRAVRPPPWGDTGDRQHRFPAQGPVPDQGAALRRRCHPRGGSIEDQLREAAPDGIDAVFDNVGGEQLSAALALARRGARVALVGTLSGQISGGFTAPVEIDTGSLILRGITLRGLSGSDHLDAIPQAMQEFGRALREGAIVFPHTCLSGIDQAPQALCELLQGRHIGAVVVEL